MLRILRNKFQKGFTLIELLVVISIIGILIAVGTSSYQRAVRLSRDSKRKGDLEQLRQALETYRSEVGSYPANTGLLVPTYIQQVPTDPKAYTYFYSASGNTYSLCAKLEITPTSTGCTSNSCGTGGSCNYLTTNP